MQLPLLLLSAVALAAARTTVAPAAATEPAASVSRTPRTSTSRALPAGSLIIGYGTTCDQGSVDHIIDEARAGVNVIIWFAANLANKGGMATIQAGPNHTCVAVVAHKLRTMGLVTSHMLCVGGWDAPHPDTSWDGTHWAKTWVDWNAREAAVPQLDFPGYDGIDWDLEGADNKSSPINHFSVDCMELIGTMSQELKRAGFIVSMVPPQSYLDVTTSRFDRSLLHAYADFQPNFTYHSYNCYALFLARYGTTAIGSSEDVATFDFVDVQLYESFSRASQAIDGEGQDPAKYLVDWVRSIERGWLVDFGTDALMKTPTQNVSVPAMQLVVGLSHGNRAAPHWKSVFIEPSDVSRAWAMLEPAERPRGAMFWNLQNDGAPSWYPNGTVVNVTFARELNRFLRVRK